MSKKALERAFERAKRIEVDLRKEKFIIFSDQHIGDGKWGSDDFQRNREIYYTALNHYYENGFNLISVGDTEELWECDFDKILQFNGEIYEMEKLFLNRKRLIRIFGNHDRFWSIESFREKNYIFGDIDIVESVLINGKIFIAHGHQGELESDILWPLSRWVVRHIWKPFQRLTGIPSNSPAQNWKVRDRREEAYYQWAKKRKILFIAGHTHRAMFESLSKIDRLKIKVEELKKSLEKLTEEERNIAIEEIEKLNGMIEKSIIENRDGNPERRLEKGIPVPCYFNSGCCLYPNGITGIEIENGFIRLVKWGRVDKIKRKIFEEESLEKILAEIG